ncbi:hypothetical protein [Gottfriedia acidiceleris]|uniref:hypothetical protein n=1 Tax=Gottfriedia acidiceleris TaxID=371036 RepID=UPI000B452D9E|nr:hypothetical protein [Gottfriedia acidiceleris]
MDKLIKTFVIFALLFLVSGCNSTDKPSVLKGTFVCKDLPGVSLVFDPDDFNKFYYYNPYSKNFKVDSGKYSKKANTKSKYIVNSIYFHDIVINFKNEGFKFKINGKNYYFKQSSSTPIVKEQ